MRKAIGVGVVGANIEDQMKPLDEAVRNVEAIMDAAISEGVPDFVLNARTDAFVLGRDRDPADVLAEAVERGKAYLEAGAPTVFVPGLLDEEQITTLVEAYGRQRLTVIGFPGSTAADRLEELGVARISYGPQPLRVALTALQKLVEEIHRGGGVDREHATDTWPRHAALGLLSSPSHGVSLHGVRRRTRRRWSRGTQPGGRVRAVPGPISPRSAASVPRRAGGTRPRPGPGPASLTSGPENSSTVS